MDASRKSVKEMNADMSKNDRGIWPNSFLKLWFFFMYKYVQTNSVFYMCNHYS